jgi:hypothetical protein
VHEFARLHCDICGYGYAIESRQNFNATGKYKVIIPDGKVHEILFHTITVGPDGHTMATAMIYENNPISFGKYFDVIGQVGMISTRKHFQYTGGFRINESCHAGLNPYVGFDTIIDPFNVRIPVSKPTDMKGIPLQCGFYWDGSTDSYHGSFLRYPHSDLDIPVFEQSGVLFYENSSSSFKIDEYVQKQRPQLLSLKTKRCFLSGNGKLDFDIDMHFVDIQTYGDMNYHMIPDSTSLNLFLTLDFSFDQKVMSVMSDSLNAVNLKAINLSEGNYVGAISQLISDEEAEKVISDISNYGYYRRLPQTLQKSIVISNVKMVFNRETNTFVSEGQIGISNLYDVSVNKYVNGYIELEKGKTSGSFKIYLQPTNQQWYYFDYKSGVLQAISSSGQFNNELMSIKQEKRIKMDTETGEQYEYVISTRRKAIEFLRTMQPENE